MCGLRSYAVCGKLFFSVADGDDAGFVGHGHTVWHPYRPVLNLRKALYVPEELRALNKRVKVFAILDIVFGVLTVLVMLGAFLLSYGA